MKLKSKIIIPVLALLLASTVSVTLLNYYLAKKTVDQMVDEIVESGLKTLESQVSRTAQAEKIVIGEFDKKNIALAHALAEIIRLNSETGSMDLQNAEFCQKNSRCVRR